MLPFVPVLRPKLPCKEALLPWLEQIDQNRWYSNFGPLEELLRTRLSALAGLDADQIALASSGTAALTLALRARVGKLPSGICVAPSWTHLGTATAIVAAGLTPFLVDCEPETWGIDPLSLRSVVDLSSLSAVVPVAAFGNRIDYAAWDAFSRETGVPVVIDAAASFDQFVNFGREIPWGRTPVMISLHATKAFGAGEGGMLLCDDAALIRQARQLSNFGIYEDEPIEDAFANVKMSEYAAAVGLASLDGWPQRRREVAALTQKVRSRMEHLGATLAPGFGDRFVSSTCMISVPSLSAARLEELLTSRAIGVRRWWRNGVHALPAFRSAPRSTALPTTETIAATFLGVPFYPDLDDASLDRVFDGVARARETLHANS